MSMCSDGGGRGGARWPGRAAGHPFHSSLGFLSCTGSLRTTGSTRLTSCLPRNGPVLVQLPSPLECCGGRRDHVVESPGTSRQLGRPHDPDRVSQAQLALPRRNAGSPAASKAPSSQCTVTSSLSICWECAPSYVACSEAAGLSPRGCRHTHPLHDSPPPTPCQAAGTESGGGQACRRQAGSQAKFGSDTTTSVCHCTTTIASGLKLCPPTGQKGGQETLPLTNAAWSSTWQTWVMRPSPPQLKHGTWGAHVPPQATPLLACTFSNPPWVPV